MIDPDYGPDPRALPPYPSPNALSQKDTQLALEFKNIRKAIDLDSFQGTRVIGGVTEGDSQIVRPWPG